MPSRMTGSLFCALLFFVGLVDSFPGSYEDSMDLRINSNQDNLHTRSKRALPASNVRKWMLYNEDGNWIIPYVIRQDYPTPNPLDNSPNGTDLVLQAVTDYHENSCIRFRPRTTESRYITFRFFHKVGRICGDANPGEDPGYRFVNINVLERCDNMRTLRHELFHTLFFLHEHLRPDRDDYVTAWEDSTTTSQNKFSNQTLTAGYDIFSISHYEGFILKHNSELNWEKTHQLSYDDIEAINLYYNCPRSTVQKQNCDVLPTVVENGEVYPLQDTYKHKQGVRLLCDNGYLPAEEHYSYCEDGVFVPSVLKCEKATKCEDEDENGMNSRVCRMLIANNDNFCDWSNPQNPFACQKSCGACNADICTILPTMYGSGKLSSTGVGGSISSPYSEGTQIQVFCNDEYFPIGLTTSTCINGEFDVKVFQCVPLKTPTIRDICGYRKVEGATLESCIDFYPYICTLPDLHIEHGRLNHEHSIREGLRRSFFHKNDYVVLECDRGYQPVSSPLAQCLFNKATNTPQWSQTRLECVPIPVNQSGCATLPVFNRKRSTISPMKFRYEYGEEVNITCHPGYHLNPHYTTTTTCTEDGQFDRNLYKACEEGGHGYCNNYFQYNYGNGQHDKYPIMDFYPHGFQVKVRCLTASGRYDRRHGSNHDIMQCNSHHYTNWEFNVSMSQCIRETNICSGEKLYSETQKMHVRLQPWNSTWDVETVYEHGLEEGESIKIDCGIALEPMGATCKHGSFRYKNVCNFTRTVELATTQRSCNSRDLPQVHGESHYLGRFHPNKSNYKHNEEVLMTCEPGHVSVTDAYFYCQNGKFSVDTFICAAEKCTDEVVCTPESCHDPTTKGKCQLTCGICEGNGCFIDSYGADDRKTLPEPNKSIYRHGENVTVSCTFPGDESGEWSYQKTAKCWNGYFDRAMPWCRNIYDIVFIRADSNLITSEYCEQISDECYDDTIVRYKCGLTCLNKLKADHPIYLTSLSLFKFETLDDLFVY